MRALSLAGQAARRVPRDAGCALRQRGKGRGDLHHALRVHPVRRHARGARFPDPRGLSVPFGLRSGGFGACGLKGSQGDLAAERASRAAPPRVCVRVRRPLRAAEPRRGGNVGRGAVCGPELLSHLARPHGRGEEDEAHPAHRCARRGRRRAGSLLRARVRLRRGGGDARRRDALPLCDAGQKNLFGRGRARHHDLAGLLALSHPCDLRAALREKNVRRKGACAPCGVCTLPRRSRRDREVSLPCRGRFGDAFFSFRRSSRALFQAGRRESTCPRRARREERSRPSRGRA